MDPNVQVALIGVFTTFITTMGIVGAAYITSLQNRAKSAEKVVEEVVDDDIDEIDVMRKLYQLITENEHKESLLAKERRKTERLERENRRLRAENTMLRLGHRQDPESEPDL
jgi:flagellar motor component MotA